MEHSDGAQTLVVKIIVTVLSALAMLFAGHGEEEGSHCLDCSLVWDHSHRLMFDHLL